MIFSLADIISGVFTGINQFIEYRRINEWTKLILSCVFTFWLSAAFSCGALMAAKTATAVAVGTGLMTGSSLATLVFRRSPLSKGLILALPEKEAEVEMNTNLQVITKT